MDLWKRLKEYLSTDIEVTLTQRPGAAYAAIREDTRLGGALSRVADDERHRCIFHQGFPLNGSYVSLHCGPDKSIVTIYRTGADSVTIFVNHEGADGWKTTEHRLHVKIGTPTIIEDGLGRPITVSRIRHRDFILFPRP